MPTTYKLNIDVSNDNDQFQNYEMWVDNMRDPGIDIGIRDVHYIPSSLACSLIMYVLVSSYCMQVYNVLAMSLYQQH